MSAPIGRADFTLVHGVVVNELDRLELMIAIEEQFDIEIDDDDLEKLNAVGDLIRFIEAHQAA
jgi:acyl carrier protein